MCSTYCTHMYSLMLGNHRGILAAVGFTDVREYCYWNAEGRNLDFNGMMGDLKVSRSGLVIT